MASETTPMADVAGGVQYQARSYMGMAGEIVVLGPFARRDLDKEAPPSVTLEKLKTKLTKVSGSIDFVREGETSPLVDTELVELEEVGAPKDIISLRILQRPVPDRIFTLLTVEGDEGCPRSCAQEVDVMQESKKTAKEVMDLRKQKGSEWKGAMRVRLSLKAIKKDPAKLAKLTDHVFMLLKVYTDQGQPGNPNAMWEKFAYIDEKSAAADAKKLFHECIWDFKDGWSDGEKDRKAIEAGGKASEEPEEPEPKEESEAEEKDSGDEEEEEEEDIFAGSDCSDYCENLENMEDDVVLHSYGTSIRIVQVMLPGFPVPPPPAKRPREGEGEGDEAKKARVDSVEDEEDSKESEEERSEHS